MTQTWTLSPSTRSPAHHAHKPARRPGRSAPTDPNMIDMLLEYELYSSWWADRVPFGWAQKLTGRYFAWKVERKLRRYRANIELVHCSAGPAM